MLLLLCMGCVQEPTVVDPVPHGPDSAMVITLENFDSLVTASATVALVEFYRISCPTCQAMAWIIDSLAVRFGAGALVGASNADTDTLWRRFSLGLVPSFLFFRDGVEVTRREYHSYDSAAYDTLAALLGNCIDGLLKPAANAKVSQ